MILTYYNNQNKARGGTRLPDYESCSRADSALHTHIYTLSVWGGHPTLFKLHKRGKTRVADVRGNIRVKVRPWCSEGTSCWCYELIYYQKKTENRDLITTSWPAKKKQQQKIGKTIIISFSDQKNLNVIFSVHRQNNDRIYKMPLKLKISRCCHCMQHMRNSK